MLQCKLKICRAKETHRLNCCIEMKVQYISFCDTEGQNSPLVQQPDQNSQSVCLCSSLLMCNSTQEHWVLLIPTEVQKEGGRPTLVMNRLVIFKKIQQKRYDFQVHLVFSIIISLRLPRTFFFSYFPLSCFFFPQKKKKKIFFIVYLEEAYFSFSKSSYSNREGGKTTHSIMEDNEHLRTENR